MVVPSPTAVGNVSEGAIAAAYLKAGACVFLPIGNQAGYDMVVEYKSRLLRVQCRTGRLRAGAIRFNLSTMEKIWRTRRVRHRPTAATVDVFAVYCPDNDTTYVVPNDGMCTREVALRLDPTKNGQTVGVRWARDFKLIADEV